MRCIAAIQTSFLLGCASLSATQQSDLEKMREAKTWVEAEDYGKARELYQYLYKQQSDGWKKGILLYDIATTYLFENAWEEAIHHYEKIPLGKEPYPLLLLRIKTNEAVARWRLSRELYKQVQEDPASYQENYVKILFLIKKALENVDAAEQAHCRVLDLAGDDHCVPAHDLEALRSALEQGHAILLEDYTTKRTAQISLKEGVSLLLSGVNGIILALNKLPEDANQSHAVEQQLQRIQHQSLTWKPLLSSLKEKMGDIKNPKVKSDFDSVERRILSTLSQLADDGIQPSLKKLKVAEASLNDLLFLLLESDPIQDSIQKVLASYEQALESTPLQGGDLYGIADQQETMKELFQRKELDPKVLDEAIEELNVSITLTQLGKAPAARIALLSSFQAMRRISWQFDTNQGSAQHLIEHSISEQLYSLMVNQLLEGIIKEHNATILGKGPASQQGVVTTASPFWETVIEEQEEAFHAEQSDAVRCQVDPWSKVVPLFDKGYDHAAYALDILKKGSSRTEAFHHQQMALQYWKEALQALNDTEKRRETCESPPQGGDQEQQPSPESKPQQQKEQKEASIDEVLRLLQQMEHDDRQKRRRGTMIDTGEKQW